MNKIVCICMYLLILCMCCTSCFRANNGEKRKNTAYADKVELMTEEILIPPSDKLLLKSYYVSSSFNCDSMRIVVGYNNKEHALDLISLNGKKAVQLKLSQEGPAGITRGVGGLYVHSLDSIWICDDTQHAYLLNSKGEMIDKVALSDAKSDGVVTVMANYAMSVVKFCYNKQRKSLFYAIEVVKDAIPILVVNELTLGERRVVNSYELTPSIVESIITFKDYGYLYRPNISFTENKIIYNYPIESSVYTIDLETGKRDIFTADSKFTPNIVPKCLSASTYEARELFALENVHFYEIMYMPKYDLYCRLHVGAADTANEKDPWRLNASRKLILTLFDSNFNIVNELELPSCRYSYYTGWCALFDGLLIFVDNSLSESELTDDLIFDIYSPNLNKE